VGAAAYNRSPSSERAAVVAAYLTDDVEGWLAWYRGKPSSHKWSTGNVKVFLSITKDGRRMVIG